MGAILWLATGCLAFALARFIPPRRRGWRGELAVAVTTAFVLGVAATALDFGGWREPDPRAAAFCALGAAAVIAVFRSFG